MPGRPGSNYSRTPDPQLDLGVRKQGPVVVITVAGELDMATVPALAEEIAATLDRMSPLTLTLDLSEVCFFSAAGITALLDARTTVADRGAHLTLRNPSPIVHQIMRLGGVDEIFEIGDDPSE
ncbi:STAS domain-containing protein [Actinoplanes sp. NPDC049265]|uniref:STAS domain-containing protein n=1 Tax=Actinoplanes sp. NPDC049265 TaxID=3363902 RepID=UPI00372406CA